MNDLLYGKDKLEKVVNLEVKDSTATIFIQENNQIKRIEQSCTNWILCNEKLDESWKPLDGNLHYKFIKFIETDQDFYQTKKFYQNSDIFFINNPKERFMVAEGLTYYKDLHPKDVSILSFDIETTTLDHNDKAKILIIANTFRNQKGTIRKLFAYDEYKNQGELLKSWCEWVREIDPSIMVAHNGNLFDLPYINFIAKENGVKLKLGRDNSSLKFDSWESKFRKDSSQFYHYYKPKIWGREIIDTLFLALKYDVGRKYENYRLKNIIKQEGLEKVDRTFYDADQIRNKYKIPEEWIKIKEYAKDDGDDALVLYDLMCPSIFYFTQMIPKSFQLVTESATGSQINSILVRSYLQDNHSIPKADEPIRFEGAISHGVSGIHNNVLSFDVASLYPSIMIEYEVCNIEKDPKRYFIELVKTLTMERLKNKKLAKETGNNYYRDLEQSQKIAVNSAYGFLGAKGLNFNYLKGAAFITATGREILQTAIQWATGKGYDDWKKENNL